MNTETQEHQAAWRRVMEALGKIRSYQRIGDTEEAKNWTAQLLTRLSAAQVPWREVSR